MVVGLLKPWGLQNGSKMHLVVVLYAPWCSQSLTTLLSLPSETGIGRDSSAEVQRHS